MRCAFNPAIKCDYITNNIAEVFNNWIRDYKDLHAVDLVDKIREMILILWDKRRRIGERLHGRILLAVMHQLKGKTRGLGHLNVVSASLHTAEVSDNGKDFGRHVVSVIAQTCTCKEWQHTGQPCGHALAFLTTQKNVNLEEYVDVCYSVEKFKAAYKREIPALPDKSHWPEVDLFFNLGAPLGKRGAGRQRKLRIKGCLETSGKSSAKSDDKRKKMVRGPVTCKRCGEKGHRQASYKCPMNGTKKKRRLAMLLGHRSGTTGEAGGNLGGSTSGGADCTLGASTSGGAGCSLGGNSSTIPKKKKLTPKKMKKT